MKCVGLFALCAGLLLACENEFAVRLLGDGRQNEEEIPRENAAPTAILSAPNQVMIGETIDLSGEGSSDSDGSIEKCEWLIDSDPLATGCKIAYTFQLAG